MSLLPNRDVSSLREDGSVPEIPCWEQLGCKEEFCPAYKSDKGPCWMIPRTHCQSRVQNDFGSKLDMCLACKVFRREADGDPLGWNHFLAEQVRAYCSDVLKHAYQREERFFQILDRLPDGLFTTDSEWKITYMNPAAETIIGISAYDAVGMYCKDVFKNTICEMECAVKQAVVTGRNIYNREYRIRNAYGNEIPIICSTAVLRGEHGEPMGGIEVFKDITEKKRLEEERIASELKFRRIFQNSQDMIYLATPEGALLDVNPAGVSIMGYRNKEDLLSVGSMRRLFVSPEDADKFRELIHRDGWVKDFESELVCREGSTITVLINGNAVYDSEGDITLVEGSIKDITQRKEAERSLRQRNRELQLLNNIALTINLTMDLDSILQFSLESLLSMLGIDTGAVFLIDRGAGGAVLRAQVGLKGQRIGARTDVQFKDERLMQALFEENITFAPKPRFPSFQALIPADPRGNRRNMHCFLITVKNRASGFFALEIPPGREFHVKEKSLMGSLGNFLGAAIENTRLLDAQKRHREDLQRLTGELFQSQERERKHIARELHDEAGQALTGVNFSLETVLRGIPENLPGLRAGVLEAKKQLSRTYNEIRRLSHRLHPASLSDLGLEPALRQLLDHISKNSGLNVAFNMVGFDSRLDPEVETVLYRFSQEALQNTLKHSGAENFRLSLIRSYPHIIFVAEDDGVGFDPESLESSKMSLGLLGMRERAAMLSGTFAIKTVPGRGTRIRIELPGKEMYEDEEEY